MSHTLAPRAQRRSEAPDLPYSLAAALQRVRGDFTDLEGWELLDECCREFDRPDEAVALYTEALASKLSLEDLSDVGRFAADFCEEWYEETAPVLEMLTAVLEADPEQSWAFDRLTVLLTVSAEWDALLKAYDTALDATQDEKRQRLLLAEAAKSARDFASRPEVASDYLKRLLILSPDDEQLANALERRLDEQGRHQDLIEIWTARLPIVTKVQALKLRLQVARRYLDSLQDAASALAVVEEFRELGGDGDDACELLERLSDSELASDDVRRKALRLLASSHESSERWEAVIAALERSLTLAETHEEQVSLHRRSAELLAQYGDGVRALGHCTQLLELDPSSEEARTKARELAEQAGSFDLYAKALTLGAERASDEGRRIELLLEAAQVHKEQLSDGESAIELYRRVELDETSDSHSRLLACCELGALLEASGRREELLVVLERKAELERGGNARAATLAQAAQLASELGQDETALALWSLRVEDNSQDIEALSARIVILARLSRYEGLVEALTTRAGSGLAKDDQRADLVCAAGVLADRMDLLPEAIAMWHSIERRLGRDPDSIDALIRLSGQAELYDQVAELLKEAISEEGDPQRKVLHFVSLGDAQRLHCDAPEEALISYDAAIAMDPEHSEARAALRSLISVPEQAHAASEALAFAFRRTDDFAEILSLLELRLAAAPSDEFRSHLLSEAAEIEEKADNLGGALLASGQAFSLIPSETNEVALHRLGELSGDFEAVSAAYGDAIAHLSEATEGADLYFARGLVEEEKLSRPREAALAYLEAFRRSPGDEKFVSSVIRAAQAGACFRDAAWALVENSRFLDRVSPELLGFFAERVLRHGDWTGTLSGLAEAIDTTEGLSSSVAHDLRVQLASWYRDQSKDLDSAEEVLKHAVADETKEESLRMLADLQRRSPGEALVMTLTTLADVCGDDLSVLREAATVALGLEDEQTLAAPLLKKAMEVSSLRFAAAVDPFAADAMAEGDVAIWSAEHLARLALFSDRAGEAVELLEKTARLPLEDTQRLELRFRAAMIADEAGLSEKALVLCEEVLKAESKHEGAISVLSSLHEKAGRLDELLDLRSRELSLDRPLERRLFLRLDQSRVLGQLGAELGERIAVLNRNLEDSPGHPDSIEALAAILTAEESYEGLAKMLEHQAKAIAAQEPERAASLWEEAGRVVDEQLEDEVRLTTDLKLSAAAHPSILVLDRLAFLAAKNEDRDSEVSWLQLRLSLTPEAAAGDNEREDRRRVVERLSSALLASDERALARRCLEDELLKDPAADEVRQSLSKIYREFEQWKELSQLLVAGVEFVDDDVAKIAYLRSSALVERRRLGNLDAVVPLLESAILIDGEDRSLQLLLADTLRTAERFDEATLLLEKILAGFGRRRTKEKASVHTQLARIALAQGRPKDALERAEAAAKIERTDPVILMLVGQLARQEGQLERAEQAYRTLALIASRRSDEVSEDELEEVGESSVLYELYRIAEEKGESGQSRELLDSALEVATRDPEEALRLSAVLKTHGQDGLLLEAIQERLDDGAEGELAARLLVTKARMLEQVERFEEALEARSLALSKAPHEGLLIDSTQKLAEQCGQELTFWRNIEELAEKNAETPQIAGELWYRAGLAAESTEELGRAAGLFELSQGTAHKSKRAFVALDRVLDVKEEPARVEAALLRFVDSSGVESSPDVLANALYRLASFELASSRVIEGSSHLRRSLDFDGQDERAVQLLEPIVRAGTELDSVVMLFLRVCKNVADAPRLLFAYLEAAKLSSVEGSLLSEAIEEAKKLKDGEALRVLLSRAIDVAEQRDEVSTVREFIVERAALARQEAHYELESELLEKAAACFEEEEGFELRLQWAFCLSEHLHNPDKGQAIFERLFELAPNDSRVWRPLLAIHREAGRIEMVEELISIVEGEVIDEADLEALKMERIRLMVQAERIEEAEVELQAILSERPHMVEAASILADLFRKTERWDELRELVEGLFDRARERGDANLVERFGLELAQLVVAEDRLEAISVLSAGLSFVSDRESYLETLQELYCAEDDQGELSDVMEMLLVLKRGSEVQDLAFKLYQMRQELDDDFGAGRALEIAVEAAPEQEELLQVYVEHLQARDEHPRLVLALLLQAERLGKTEAGALLFSEASKLYDEKLSDPQGAADAMTRAYECDPTNSIYLERGAQFLVSLGQIDEALASLKIAIDAGDEMALADLLELRAGIIARDRALDCTAMTMAASDLELALAQLIPEEQEETIKQRRIEVLKGLRLLHQGEADAARERAVVLDLASMLKEQGDGPGGIEVLASWLKEHPSDTEGAALLGSTATEAGDHASAVLAYEKMVQESGGELKVNAVLLLADAAEAAGTPLDARSALEEAFSVDPGEQRLRRRLRLMYEVGGEFKQLAEVLMAEADKSEDPDVRASLLADVGDLYMKAELFESAGSVYEQALEITAAPYPVTSRLARAYLALGEVKRAEEVLTEAVRAHGKRRSPDLALLQTSLAQVSQAMGNEDGMFAWLEAALMSDRNNSEIACELASKAQEQGRYEIAIKALQSLTLCKSPGSISKAEAYFRQAQIAQAQGDSRKALLMARRAQSTDPQIEGVEALIEELSN